MQKVFLACQFVEDDDSGEVDESLLFMTPSSFMSPIKDAPASLSLVGLVCLALDSRRGNAEKVLHELPRRRRIDETTRESFPRKLSEEEWERRQSKLERNTGVTWSRVAFIERIGT